MNILFAHVYNKDNKGDAAIVSSMLVSFRRYFPNSNITLSTIEGTKKNKSFENAPMISSFFHEAIYRSSNPVFRILLTIYILVGTWLWAKIYSKTGFDLFFLVNKSSKDILNTIIQSDIVVGVGGGYILGNNSIQSTITIALAVHQFEICSILDRKFYLYSQSIGPFGNKFQELIARKVLNKAEMIFAREDITIKTLKRIGVKDSLMKRSVDAAFAFLAKPVGIDEFFKKKKIPKNKTIIGITTKKCLPAEKQAKYENAIARVVDKYSNNKSMYFIFIPQVTATEHNDDDRVIARTIAKKILKNKNILLIEDELDHYMIKSLYGRLDFLIGTRFHSVIFSLTALVPCLAIAYEYKTNGIMTDLGLESWVIEASDVTEENLGNMFSRLLESKESYKQKVQKVISKYVNMSQQATQLIFQNTQNAL